VLLLREVEGMTYEEIAEALALPVGTVESRLHRARKGLARAVGPWRRREEDA
jgi:RNA polymerase sigma-70 factor, ECF subfamily